MRWTVSVDAKRAVAGKRRLLLHPRGQSTFQVWSNNAAAFEAATLGDKAERICTQSHPRADEAESSLHGSTLHCIFHPIENEKTSLLPIPKSTFSTLHHTGEARQATPFSRFKTRDAIMAGSGDCEGPSLRTQSPGRVRETSVLSAELLPDWLQKSADAANVPAELESKMARNHIDGQYESLVYNLTVVQATEPPGFRHGDCLPLLQPVSCGLRPQEAESVRRPALAPASGNASSARATRSGGRKPADSLCELVSEPRSPHNALTPAAPTAFDWALPDVSVTGTSACCAVGGAAKATASTRAGTIVALPGEDPGEEAWGRSTARVREALGIPAPAALAGLMPDWEDDSSRCSCAICGRAFVSASVGQAALARLAESENRGGMWRHHCRCCGVLVCCRCASHTVELLALGRDAKPVRICNLCHFDITASSEVARVALVP